MKMAIRLQIVDKNNKILQDDEITVNDGDILLCQLSDKISDRNMLEQISKNLTMAFKRAHNEQISPIIYDSNINFKVLKIRRDK
jgi:hypothetical protein